MCTYVVMVVKMCDFLKHTDYAKCLKEFPGSLGFDWKVRLGT